MKRSAVSRVLGWAISGTPKRAAVMRIIADAWRIIDSPSAKRGWASFSIMTTR